MTGLLDQCRRRGFSSSCNKCVRACGVCVCVRVCVCVCALYFLENAHIPPSRMAYTSNVYETPSHLYDMHMSMYQVRVTGTLYIKQWHMR